MEKALWALAETFDTVSSCTVVGAAGWPALTVLRAELEATLRDTARVRELPTELDLMEVQVQAVDNTSQLQVLPPELDLVEAQVRVLPTELDLVQAQVQALLTERDLMEAQVQAVEDTR